MYKVERPGDFITQTLKSGKHHIYICLWKTIPYLKQELVQWNEKSLLWISNLYVGEMQHNLAQVRVKGLFGIGNFNFLLLTLFHSFGSKFCFACMLSFFIALPSLNSLTAGPNGYVTREQIARDRTHYFFYGKAWFTDCSFCFALGIIFSSTWREWTDIKSLVT